MIRFGLGILVAATTCAVGIAACSSSDGGTPVTTGTGGAGVGGGASSGGAANTAGASGAAGASTASAKCEGACCPAADPACYSTPAGNGSPGSECQATYDNTGKAHIQMRQTWIRSSKPDGNTSAVVYGSLAGRTEFPAPQCNQGLNKASFGAGGYILLTDLYRGGSMATPPDPTKDYMTTGFAAYLPDATALTAALTNGMCYGAEKYKPDAKYALSAAEIAIPDNPFPKGLPAPLGGKDGDGWAVGPTKGYRLSKDFDLKTDRLDLLTKLASDGAYGSKGFAGVFYYDEAAGTVHGWGPLGWVVVEAADGKTHISIPIRENESRSTVNNAASPNCVGRYRADAVPSSTCKSPGPDNPAWGCKTDAECPAGTGPGTSAGYFLISELEQIYSPDLAATLCVTNPGNDPATGKPVVAAGGFLSTDGTSCKGPNWNPLKESGLPNGDWCAKTNQAATPDCHDAWHSVATQTFSAAKIAGVPDDSAAAITTCKYSPL